jgi:hypothetical protein
MGGQGGADLSIDTQTGFGGDTGQHEMGWTGSAPVGTASTHEPGESPMHSAPEPGGTAYNAPSRPDEAPARLPEAPRTEPAPERAPPTAAPDHRPQVAWSSPPPAPHDHDAEGPPSDEQ